MKGLGKILFGGILGAIVGFLVAPRGSQIVRDALLGRGKADAVTAGPVLSAGRGGVHVDSEEASLAGTAVAEPPTQPSMERHWTSTIEEPTVAAPPAFFEPPETEAVAIEEIEETEAEEAGTQDVTAIQPEWAQAEAAEVMEVVEEPPAYFDTETVETAPESESLVVEAPEVLEEPVAGLGWEAPSPKYDEGVPSEAEVAEPPEAEVVEPAEYEAAPVVLAEEGAEVAEVADLKARIEETRRRIQRELEHPFEDTGAVPAEAPTAEAEQSTPAEVEHGPPSEQWSPAPSVEQFESGVESVVETAEVLETEERPPSEDEVLAAESPTELTSVVDEGPFMRAAELPEAAEQVPFPPPVAEETPWEEPAPVSEIEVTEVEAEAVSAIDASAQAEETPAGETPSPEETPAAEPKLVAQSDGSTFDHEAMRRRIEETRNRLKAKAFDAMMSGETALLARDGEDARHGTATTQVQVDTEVSDTIENTLTEEDD